MKILIIGANGQVGNALTQNLIEYELIPLTRQDCDLSQSGQIGQTIDKYKPDLIINSAAYTMVDQAEDEQELVFLINRDAPKVLSEKAREFNIPFIHFSTDYVFDGKKKGSYSEDDQTNPLGIYGQSKLAGEEAIQETGGQNYIFRTSWVYSNVGHNFYLTIRQLSQKKNELKVVADQFGVPTTNLFIAEQIKKIIPNLNQNNTGVYNLVPDGSCSWNGFAKAIISKTNQSFNLKKLYSIQTDQYPTNAKRPANSILNNDKIKKTFGLTFNDWKEELDKIISR